MAKTLCQIIGVALLLTGLIALYLGFAGAPAAARLFCLIFGAVYLLLAILGFVAPGVVASVLGHAPLSAGELTPDNAVHVLLGAALLVAGLMAPRSVVRTA